MADEKEWKTLKTIDKIVHKSWKCRLMGYDDIIKEINISEEDYNFSKYASVMSRLVSDSNAVALEKAIDVVLLFVQRSNPTDNITSEICPKIISNCLGSTRPKTREKGNQLLKLLIEAEKHEIVVKELLKCVGSKQPSIVIGCTTVLKESLREFGPSIVQIKECSKILPQLLEDRDKNVRDAGKELIVEIYRWIGKQALTPQINNLKSVILKEICAEFEKLPFEKAVATRYLRSQTPKTVSASILRNEKGTDKLATNIDQYDLIEAIDVISKVPSDFYDRIEDKKWTVRRDVLEVIDKLTNHDKLLSGDFGDLVKTLLRVLSNDANIVLVMMASKILVQLAKGLRKRFAPFATATIQACLDKFKDKKPTVVKSLRDCVDIVYETTTLDSISPSILMAMGHKNPTVKLEAAMFLNRILLKTPKEILMKKLLKQLIPAVVRLSLDNASDVREASFQILGTAMKVVSENVIMPYLEQIDNVRMARINEYYSKEEQENIVPQVVAQVVRVKNASIFDESRFADTHHSIFQCTQESDIEMSNKSPSRSDNNECEETVVGTHSSHESDSPDLKTVNIRKRKKTKFDSRQEHGEIADVQQILPDELPAQTTEKCEYEDEFIKMMKRMKAEENTYTESYNRNIVFNQRWERFLKHRDIIAQDPIKKLIASIINNDIDMCGAAIQTIFDQQLLEQALFLRDYGCFLVIVVIRQLSLIIDKLYNFNKITSGNCRNVIQNLLYIAKYIMSNEREPCIVNEAIIVASLVVFKNVVNCSQLNNLSDAENIVAWIKLIVRDLYHRTKELPIADNVRLLSTMICAPNIVKIDPFHDMDLVEVIDGLYDDHIQAPIDCAIMLSKDHDEHAQIKVDMDNDMCAKINERRQKFGMYPTKF